MAYRFGKAFIDLTANAKPLYRVLRTAGNKLKSFGRISFRYAKRAAIGLAAAYTLVVLAAMKQEKAEVRLKAVLKATGNAAGFTFKQLKKLASELQKVTIHGDEALLPIIALLATFKQIQGPIFKKAIMAILDMSEVMEQDLKTSAIQVGKALNDPILGMTTLTRIGVAFTEQQKDAVKYFMETNQVAKAQTIILRELESQFGGTARAAAKTTAGAIKQFKNALGDAAEIIGNIFLPSLKKLSTKMKEWLEGHPELLKKWGATLAAHIEFVKDIFWTLITWLKQDWKSAFEANLDVVVILFKLFMDSIYETITARLPQIGDAWRSFWRTMTKPFEWALRKLGDVEAADFIKKAYAAKSPEQRAAGATLKIKALAQRAFEEIKDLLPADVRNKIEADFKELEKTLAAIEKEYEKALKNKEKSNKKEEKQDKLDLSVPPGFGKKKRKGAKPEFIETRDLWKKMAMGALGGDPALNEQKKQSILLKEIAAEQKAGNKRQEAKLEAIKDEVRKKYERKNLSGVG